MNVLLINLITTLHFWGVPVSTANATQVAQVDTSSSRVASDRAENRYREAQRVSRSLSGQKQKLRKTYNSQLAEVDRLKRSRASWRRDRQLREQKARSQVTASALQSIDSKIRSQKARLLRERSRLTAILQREIRGGASGSRSLYLKKRVAALSPRLRSVPKKISMPDLELDEFADPEELLAQIAGIERAEARLLREEKLLARRDQHYSHMERLAQKRQRSVELGAFDDDSVRRSTGRSGQASRVSGEADSAGGAGSPAPEAGQSGDGFGGAGGGGGGSGEGSDLGGFAVSLVILSDVVDSETQVALQRAQRSTSPKTKAAAARRAKEQVHKRLLGLKSGKARILRHLKRLQGK